MVGGGGVVGLWQQAGGQAGGQAGRQAGRGHRHESVPEVKSHLKAS